jgi:hypothetical protein
MKGRDTAKDTDILRPFGWRAFLQSVAPRSPMLDLAVHLPPLVILISAGLAARLRFTFGAREHSLHRGGVTGSIPVAPTMYKTMKYIEYLRPISNSVILSAQDIAHETMATLDRQNTQ